MVLQADDEAVAGQLRGGRGAVLAPAVRAEVAGVEERLAQGAGQLPDLAEIGVVAVALTAQAGVDGFQNLRKSGCVKKDGTFFAQNSAIPHRRPLGGYCWGGD